MSGSVDDRYPMQLTRSDIAALLPHRGAIFVCQSLRIDGPHAFAGVARWERDNAVIAGHFPGMPIVPGVLLIEALAQLAGAGLLAGDPYLKTLPADSVGMLAGVRNCWFKQPVLPDTDVALEIRCRQMGPALVQVTGSVRTDSGDSDAARLEITVALVPRAQVTAALGG